MQKMFFEAVHCAHYVEMMNWCLLSQQRNIFFWRRHQKMYFAYFLPRHHWIVCTRTTTRKGDEFSFLFVSQQERKVLWENRGKWRQFAVRNLTKSDRKSNKSMEVLRFVNENQITWYWFEENFGEICWKEIRWKPCLRFHEGRM